MTALSDLIVADGAVGFWKLSETSGTTAVDATAHSSGTYNGTPTKGVAGLAVPDTAVTLNGSNQDISIPDVSALDVGDVFSIEALVKLAVTTGTGQQAVLTGNADWPQLAFDNVNRRYCMNVDSQGGDLVYSSVQTTDTGWHHVIITKSGATRALYIDGVARTTLGTNATAANNAFEKRIGSNQGANSWLNGTVQYVALYNVALSSTQAANHFAATGVGIAATVASGQAAGLVPAAATNTQTALRTEILADAPAGFWPGRELSGTVMASDTGSNHGTYVNTPTLGALGHLGGQPAVEINGSNEYSTVPHSAAFPVDIGSWEILIRFRRTDGANQAVFDAGPNRVQLAFDGANRRLRLNVNSVAGDVAVASVNITDSGWHHIVLTKAGATSKLYQDGVDVTTAGTNATATTTTAALTIGTNQGVSEFGELDWQYAAVYPTALSAARVLAHFDAIGIAPPAAVALLAAALPTIAAQRNTVIVATAAELQATAPEPFHIPAGYAIIQVPAAVGQSAGLEPIISATGAGVPLNLLTAMLADSPLALWRLGDTSGATMVSEIAETNGTYSGNPILAQVGRVTDSYAASFPGSPVYASASLSAFNGLADTLSYGFLLRHDAPMLDDNMTLIAKGASAVQVQVDGANDRIRMLIGATELAQANLTIDDQWHLWHAIKSGATSKIYCDGVDVTVAGTNATATGNSNPLTLFSKAGTSEFATATAQYVAVYNVALSAGQVANHQLALTQTTPPATLNAAGLLPTIVAARSVVVAAVAAALSETGQVPGISTAGSAVIPVSTGTVQPDGSLPVIMAQRQTSIAAVPASLTGNAIALEVLAQRQPTVLATAGQVTDAGLLATILLGFGATILLPAGVVAEVGNGPTISAQLQVQVLAVLAQVQADAPLAVVLTGASTTILLPPAAAAAAGLPPVIVAQFHVTLIMVPAVLAASAEIPVVSVQIQVTVLAISGGVGISAPVPSAILTQAEVLISADPALVSMGAPLPSFSTGLPPVEPPETLGILVWI